MPCASLGEIIFASSDWKASSSSSLAGTGASLAGTGACVQQLLLLLLLLLVAGGDQLCLWVDWGRCYFHRRVVLPAIATVGGRNQDQLWSCGGWLLLR